MPTSMMLAERYRLEGRIAAGGVGQVWRATDVVLDRAVAVKVLRSEFADHPAALARFRAEARHAGSVSDPAIAVVYDYGEAGAPYLVMELVDGPSLAGLLETGPLPPGRTMDIVAQTASGLAAAHAAGLVHRDIKPANLLLGPGGVVKITDFGIAYAAGSAPLTQTGTLLGTPAYLAPERASGASATPASDLYSLGVVAWECLAGEQPFTGPPLQVAAAHRFRPLPPLPPDVPGGVAALVATLTAKEPLERPASAREVAARAARLRDTMPGYGPPREGPPPAAAAFPAGAAPAGATRAMPGSPGATQAMLGHPGALDQHAPGDRPRRLLPARGVLAALAATAILAGLGGWLVAGMGGGAPPQRPAAASHSPSAPPPRPHLVSLGASTLTGRPVGVVVRRLRALGLVPTVRWRRTGAQRPGTVVAVTPTGQLARGTPVTVTGAARPHYGHPGPGNGDHHHHGNGQGHGG